MSLPITLQLPADPRYRVLAPEIASRYAELVGGTKSDGQALAATLTEALDRLASEGSADATFDVQFQPAAAGVDITVRCEGRTTVVRHALPAPKG